MNSRIAILGLGYVGLPVALGFAEHFAGTIGFDISKARVDALRTGHDWTGEASTQRLMGSSVALTNNVVTNRNDMSGDHAGTITLLADCQRAVVINASLACSSGNRCVTVEANGNCFSVVRRNSSAAFK